MLIHEKRSSFVNGVTTIHCMILQLEKSISVKQGHIGKKKTTTKKHLKFMFKLRWLLNLDEIYSTLDLPPPK